MFDGEFLWIRYDLIFVSSSISYPFSFGRLGEVAIQLRVSQLVHHLQGSHLDGNIILMELIVVWLRCLSQAVTLY